MRKILFTLALSAMLPIAALAQSYSAVLTGGAEVPGPGDADGAGLAVVTINGTSIQYSLLLQNIQAPTGAHIHRGGAGVSGDVVVNLNPSFSGLNATGTVSNVSQSLIDEIRANPSAFYVNVHTGDFQNGAIRGQLGTTQTGEGDEVLFLPVAGKVQGQNNTNFVTDVRIVNPTMTTAAVTVEFWQSNPSGASAPNATAQVTVPANGQLVLDDVTGTTVNTPGVLGAMRFVSDEPVIVSARVINDLRGSDLGTTGFAFEASELSDAKQSGIIPFLSQASSAEVQAQEGFRTNVGWFNPSSVPVNVTFSARDSETGAVLAVSTMTVNPGAQQQMGALQLIPSLANATADQQRNFYLTYTASAPVFVYGSVVDNRTGDSVYID